MARQGAVQDGVQAQPGTIRVGGGPGRSAQGGVDLVMEDQRQAGQAQEDQDGRADQARPLVDQRPGADGARAHEPPHQKSTDAETLTVRGSLRTR